MAEGLAQCKMVEHIADIHEKRLNDAQEVFISSSGVKNECDYMSLKICSCQQVFNRFILS